MNSNEISGWVAENVTVKDDQVEISKTLTDIITLTETPLGMELPKSYYDELLDNFTAVKEEVFIQLESLGFNKELKWLTHQLQHLSNG